MQRNFDLTGLARKARLGDRRAQRELDDRLETGLARIVRRTLRTGIGRSSVGRMILADIAGGPETDVNRITRRIRERIENRHAGETVRD
jgi:hypothetical protein